MTKTTGFLIIGAGIVGLTIARELKKRYPDEHVTVLEKETMPGLHSSGRNSGVLHSGIYYPPGSLKASLCGQGAKEMAIYCQERKLPLKRLGKVLLPTKSDDGPQLDLLQERAVANGVDVEWLDERSLKEAEPEAHSATGEALLVPSTAVGDSAQVMSSLKQEILAMDIELYCSTRIMGVNIKDRTVTLADGGKISYGHAINSAGLHADSVAHQFGVAHKYTLLPFKGIYWKLDANSGLNIRHLIYPVPDLRVPFLGVHTTTATDGSIYLGPTAVPAFGRENYHGMKNVTFSESLRLTSLLIRQVIAGRDGFRRLAWQEGRRYFKPWFADAARALLPRLQNKHLLPSDKVGIRAQMFDRQEGRLVTDFLVERGPSSTHILNAISPAWTSAFPFARYVIDNYIES